MRVTYQKLEAEFERVLLSIDLPGEKARQCAAVFAANSRDGVYTHGLNRFIIPSNFSQKPSFGN
jgi:3-dehydro-L-gulonate 2-dehydrogenase